MVWAKLCTRDRCPTWPLHCVGNRLKHARCPMGRLGTQVWTWGRHLDVLSYTRGHKLHHHTYYYGVYKLARVKCCGPLYLTRGLKIKATSILTKCWLIHKWLNVNKILIFLYNVDTMIILRVLNKTKISWNLLIPYSWFLTYGDVGSELTWVETWYIDQ